MTDLSTLIQECKKGKYPAQKSLHRYCHGFMISVCIRYTHDKQDAAILFNTSFLKILNKLNQYNGKGSFEGWCKKILINTFIDEYRKTEKYRENIYVTAPDEMVLLSSNQPIYSRDMAIDADEIIAMVRQLPDLTAKVFNLVAIDGYRHQEVAEMLGIGLSASKWHYASAKKRLQKMIKDFLRKKNNTPCQEKKKTLKAL